MVEGKVVVITGASCGIGRALALALAEKGARLMLAGRSEQVLRALVDEIVAASGDAVFRIVDVRDRHEVEALIAVAIDRFRRLDVIVNGAGIGPISRFDALDVAAWDAMIDVNLRGTLYGIAAALPVMKRQRSGHVVNIVSTAGLQLVPTMGVYAATKNAVRTATEVLRQESGPGLRVTEISPGVVDTRFSDGITDDDTRTKLRERLGDIGIPPNAVARAVLFALEQPDDVEIGSIVIRPTAQH